MNYKPSKIFMTLAIVTLPFALNAQQQDISITKIEVDEAKKSLIVPGSEVINLVIDKKKAETEATLKQVRPVSTSVPDYKRKITVPDVKLKPISIDITKLANERYELDKSQGKKSPLDEAMSDLTGKNKYYKLSIFLSTSLPKEVMRSLSNEASQIGSSVYFIGTPDNKISPESLIISMRSAGVLKTPEIELHPDAFTAYKIDSVPAFVLSAPDASLKSDIDGCSLPETYAKVSGDISIKGALEVMSMKAEPKMANEARYILKAKYPQVIR